MKSDTTMREAGAVPGKSGRPREKRGITLAWHLARPALLAAALALGWGLRTAAAETTNCTVITALPYTISASGTYCLNADLQFPNGSGAAINIAASDVTLDLNGHQISNPAGLGTTALGIYANSRANLTVRNGTLSQFYQGVYLGDTSSGAVMSNANVVEQLRVDNSRSIGITVRGRGNLVRGNLVIFTGGTSRDPNALAMGIWVDGNGARVLDNDVQQTFGQGAGYGAAIFVGSGDALVVGNRLVSATYGVRFNSSGTGKYANNLTSSVTTPFAGGGVSAGGNN
jgi:hypothetical protein